MSNKNEHKEKMVMANEVGKMLPETLEKVDHYKEILISESNLFQALENRQSKWYVSTVNKAREKVEMVKINNSLINKQKVFKSYMARKSKYESWLDEMAREVQPNFKKVMDEAREITTNLRLMDAINGYEEREVTPSLREKVEFYLFMQNEIMNNKKFGKKR